MDKFLEGQVLAKLTEEIENLNIPRKSKIPLYTKEIGCIISNITTKKISDPDGFTGECY